MPQSERPARSTPWSLGGGTMGVGIIAMFLGGGWKVDVVSRSASTRDGLPAACGQRARRHGQACRYVRACDLRHPARGRRGPKIDIAVETVTEDLALKQKLFAEMEALARPDCALTSNSSSFPISEIGKGLKTPGPHDGPALLHAGAPHPAGRGRALGPHRS